MGFSLVNQGLPMMTPDGLVEMSLCESFDSDVFGRVPYSMDTWIAELGKEFLCPTKAVKYDMPHFMEFCPMTVADFHTDAPILVGCASASGNFVTVRVSVNFDSWTIGQYLERFSDTAEAFFRYGFYHTYTSSGL
jgi:hypothetical protein